MLTAACEFVAGCRRIAAFASVARVSQKSPKTRYIWFTLRLKANDFVVLVSQKVFRVRHALATRIRGCVPFVAGTVEVAVVRYSRHFFRPPAFC
jgi:hypothetical protein